MDNKKDMKHPEKEKHEAPKVQVPVTTQDKLEKIRKLIEDNDTPMVTTVHGDKLISRPMKLQEAEFDGTLWFYTTKDTAKYAELQDDSRVNVAFSGKGHLSLSGNAELVTDLPLKKRLWNNWIGKFFDLEYDDPQVVLIKVNPESAEYWENVGKIKSVVSSIKSIRGDKRSEEEVNATIDLNPES